MASRPFLTTSISSGVSPVDIVLNCKPKADPSALPHKPNITEWAVHARRTEHFGTLEKHAPGPRGRNDMSKLKAAPRDEGLVCPHDLNYRTLPDRSRIEWGNARRHTSALRPQYYKQIA